LQNAISRNVEESFKKSWIRIQRRMNSENLMSSFSGRCLPVFEVWWRLLLSCSI